MLIRQETSSDHDHVFELIKSAFTSVAYSDHQEQFLVNRIRQSDFFIPELSMEAELDQQIIGHILLSKIFIVQHDIKHEVLALAPVSVSPSHQKLGIGSQLIREAHAAATNLSFAASILIGHADYYPRFGYRPLHAFGIRLPFDVPKENCMAVELVPEGLKGIEGVVEYPHIWGI